MNLHEIGRHVRRTTGGIIAINVLLTLTLAFAMATGKLAPGHGSQSQAGERTRPAAPQSALSVDEATVSKALLGKSILRTNRARNEKVIDELGRFLFKGSVNRGGTTVAFVKDTKLDRLFTVKPGDMLGRRHEVIEAGPDGIALRRGNEIFMLTR